MGIKQEGRFLLKQAQINFRNERALRASFLIQIVAMCISNVSFFIIWILFSKTIGPVNGWGPLQTFGMLSVSIFIFGMMHSVFGAIWTWSEKVPSGAFDTYLVRPKNLYLRVIGSRFSVSATGDLIQGLLGIIIFIALSPQPVEQIIWLLVMFLPAAVVQVTFLTACFSVIFWIPQAGSLGKALGNLLMLPTTQPISLLDGPLRWIYLFVVPALVVAGLPIETFIAPSLAKVALAYAIAAAWIFLSYRFFMFSVRRYESGNAIG